MSSNASLAILFSSWEEHRLTILLVVVGDVREEIVNELIIAYSYIFLFRESIRPSNEAYDVEIHTAWYWVANVIE